MYKPTRGKLVPSKDSLCTEIHRSQKTLKCETCQQCDYEIQYADHSSSLGVLARDELHLKSANGSLTKMNIVFGYHFSPDPFSRLSRHLFLMSLFVIFSLKVCI